MDTQVIQNQEDLLLAGVFDQGAEKFDQAIRVEGVVDGKKTAVPRREALELW